MSPVDLVLRIALATEGACESPPLSNAGPFVVRVLKGVGLAKGQPWCAAQLYDWGTKALGPAWPLPKTGGCQVLADFATSKKILKTMPRVGDAFLIWHPELGRFAHTGLVLAVYSDGSCLMIAGNTSGAGVRDGWLVGVRTARFAPADRFVRWATLVKEG